MSGPLDMDQVRRAFAAATALEGRERADYLARCRAADHALADELDALLRHHDAPSQLLGAPLADAPRSMRDAARPRSGSGRSDCSARPCRNSA